MTKEIDRKGWWGLVAFVVTVAAVAAAVVVGVVISLD
jgi:type III secretory pathway component EscS